MNTFQKKAYLIYKYDLKFWCHAEVSKDEMIVYSVTNLDDVEMMPVLDQWFLDELHDDCVTEAMEDGTMEWEGYPDWTIQERAEL